MRQTFDKETITREKVIQYITHDALQTEKTVYLSPAQVQKALERKQIFVTIDYILRRYSELKIVRENGLWVRKI